jgi:hypothetical protein
LIPCSIPPQTPDAAACHRYPGLRQKFPENREKNKEFAHFSASQGFHGIISFDDFGVL